MEFLFNSFEVRRADRRHRHSISHPPVRRPAPRAGGMRFAPFKNVVSRRKVQRVYEFLMERAQSRTELPLRSDFDSSGTDQELRSTEYYRLCVVTAQKKNASRHARV